MTRPRTILYVETNEDGTVGGSYRALRDLVRGLDRSRFVPRVLLYQDSEARDSFAGAGAVVDVWEEVRQLERPFAGSQPLLRRMRGLYQAIRRRAHWLRDERVDVVHLNNSPGVGFDDWLPAARLVGIPCVCHLRGAFGPRGRIAQALQGRFDAVLAVSRWLGEAAVAAGLPASRIRVVYDGVDRAALRAALRRPAPEVRAELGLGPEDMGVLLAGHLRRWKGQHVAIEALRQLAPGPRGRIRLLLAGASPPEEAAYRAALEAAVREAGLAGRVRFLGQRKDLPDLMRAADVVLHTSVRPEPFGLVVVEAMALGRPVLASRLGGPAEILSEGAGLLFDPSKPEDLARLLQQLLEQPALRARLAAGAEERAEAFDVRRTVAGVQGCYEALLGLPMSEFQAEGSTLRAAGTRTRRTDTP
jgi:glycosyltransferase involved in cell wall biosynthesis